jgi:hypothetical protein
MVFPSLFAGDVALLSAILFSGHFREERELTLLVLWGP